MATNCKREWSAKAIAWVASICSCTACSLIVLVISLLHPARLSTVDNLLICLTPYLQLLVSTNWDSQVSRNGDVVAGVLPDGAFGEVEIEMSTIQWKLQWFFSVMPVSIGIAAMVTAMLVASHHK
jgi:hypothetical protein